MFFPLAHVPPSAGSGVAPSGPRGWAELPFAWELDFLVLVALGLSAALYLRGSRRLRAALGGPDAQARARRQRLCFWAGWWTLFVALASPLHPWGQMLFTAHMVQHELLMLVAAPLLVLGRPMTALLLAFHRDDARSLSRIARRPGLAATWRGLTHPLSAWAIHAFALWLWHIPALFDATLRHEWVHHAQHLSFFGSALLFWWALLHARRGAAPVGAAVLYLFTTMLHTGLLGALIVFADTQLYPGYLATAADWGLTAHEDQQLGGLLMWAPGGLLYVGVALALLVRWLRRPEPSSHPLVSPAIARALPFLAALVLLAGCSRPPPLQTVAGGDPHLGRRKTSEFGCGACHGIPGIHGANTNVGPPLEGFALRNYIGGVLPNDGENLVRFLLDPLAHNPRSTMPKVLSDEQDARDIAAYLQTLR